MSARELSYTIAAAPALKTAVSELLEAVEEYCAADLDVEPWLQGIVTNARAALAAATPPVAASAGEGGEPCD